MDTTIEMPKRNKESDIWDRNCLDRVKTENRGPEM